MIELVESKDVSDMWIKVQELIERTKRQTIQITQLKKEVKELWKTK